MLVLMRRLGESVRIGDDITVTVTSIRKGEVKIGFSVPREIKVLREELYRKDKLNKEMQNATSDNDTEK